MSDFVNETIVEFELDGKKWAYKPVTAEEENEWMNEYMVVIDDCYTQDLSKVNKCKVRNIIRIPYTKEDIKQQIKVDKEWLELDNEEKFKFLGKLHPVLFSNVMLKIKKIDGVPEQKKKG